MIIKLTRKSKNFYTHLGRIFGSRDIQKLTHDRIYDDEGKDWYIYFNRGVPVAFVSVMKGVIKNVWSEDIERLIDVLKKVKNTVQTKDSIVTKYFRKAYVDAGFSVSDHSKNFIKIGDDTCE